MANKPPTSTRDAGAGPRLPLQPPAATASGAASCVPNLEKADADDPTLRRKLRHSTIGPQPAENRDDRQDRREH